MKNDWLTKRLGDILVENKKSLLKSKGNNKGTYPFFVSGYNIKNIDHYLIDGKNIFLPTGGAFFPHFYSGKAAYSTDTWSIRTKDDVDIKYFYYFLILNSDFIEKKLFKGSTIKHLQKKDFRNLEISVPSVGEQKRIVRTLDNVFEKVAKAKELGEKNLQNSKELFDSYLNSVFANPGKDWEHCLLNDFVKFIDYRGKTPKKTSSGIRLITAKNIKMGFLQRNPEEFINSKDYDGWMTRGIPKMGDVLFTTEAPLAMVAQLDTSEKVAFAQRTIIFQPDERKIDQTFLKYMLMSSPFQTKIHEKGTGATVKGIKASLLKKIPIYFPGPISKQEAIVKKLNALAFQAKKLEKIYERKLADLEELRRSVLSKAFRGEL